MLHASVRAHRHSQGRQCDPHRGRNGHFAKPSSRIGCNGDPPDCPCAGDRAWREPDGRDAIYPRRTLVASVVNVFACSCTIDKDRLSGSWYRAASVCVRLRAEHVEKTNMCSRLNYKIRLLIANMFH